MTPTTLRRLLCVLPAVFAIALVGCGDDGSNTLGFQDELEDTVPPGAPTNLNIADTGSALAISWAENPEPDLAGYVLEKRLDTGETWTAVADTMLVDASFEDDYHSRADYRVAAVDLSENQSAYTMGSYVAPGEPEDPKYPADQE